MKVTAKALEKGPGWGGRGKVLGAGSWLRVGREGALLLRSPKVSVRCIGPVFTEDKRGARGSQGGLTWWGRGLNLEGESRELKVKEGRDSVCLYIIYRDIVSVHACLAPQCPPLSTACSPRGVYL